MIIVMDVGNTNTKCGLFSHGKCLHSWRMATNTDESSDELGLKVTNFLQYLGIKTKEVSGGIISSVIPSVNYTVHHMFQIYFGWDPAFVGPGMKTGINILYDNPKDLGSDRIVNAVSAFETYGGPVITVDFGTATSFGAISGAGEFLGGAICPGIKISAEALTVNAAKLPRIELTKPKSVINKTTVGCMQAGILYGYVGQVDYIIRKMKKELAAEAKVVATGGLANVIATETKMIDMIDSMLTLRGLNCIYQKNFSEE